MSTAPLFRTWQTYLGQNHGSFAIDIVNHCIQSVQLGRTEPLSFQLNPDSCDESKQEIKKHCAALGLQCRIIGERDGKFTSGSCLRYHEILVDVEGYPNDLNDRVRYPWCGINKL